MERQDDYEDTGLDLSGPLLSRHGLPATLLRSPLVLGALGTVFLNAVALVLGFVLTLALSRLLGASGYGAYAFAFAWASVLSVPAVLGLTPVLVRNVSAYRAQERWAELRGLLRRANQAVVVFSAALVSVAGAAGLLLSEAEGDLRLPFLVGLSLVPLLALSSIRVSTLQALGRVVLGRLPETVVAPAVLLALVAATASVTEVSATWAIALQAVATFVAFLLGLALVRRLLPPAVKIARPVYRTRRWARSAAPLLLVSGLAAVHLHVGIVALGFGADTAEVGVYGVSTRIAALTGFLALATTYALMPEIARLHATGQRPRLESLLPQSARIVLVLSTPVAFLFIAFPAFFLGLFGESFSGGETVLRVLVAGEVIKLLFGSASAALLMTGFEDEVLKGAATGALSNVVLVVVLAPTFGAEGAAVALVLSGLAANSVHAYLAWSRAGLYTPALRLPRFAR